MVDITAEDAGEDDDNDVPLTNDQTPQYFQYLDLAIIIAEEEDQVDTTNECLPTAHIYLSQSSGRLVSAIAQHACGRQGKDAAEFGAPKGKIRIVDASLSPLAGGGEVGNVLIRVKQMGNLMNDLRLWS